MLPSKHVQTVNKLPDIPVPWQLNGVTKALKRVHRTRTLSSAPESEAVSLGFGTNHKKSALFFLQRNQPGGPLCRSRSPENSKNRLSPASDLIEDARPVPPMGGARCCYGGFRAIAVVLPPRVGVHHCLVEPAREKENIWVMTHDISNEVHDKKGHKRISV